MIAKPLKIGVGGPVGSGKTALVVGLETGGMGIGAHGKKAIAELQKANVSGFMGNSRFIPDELWWCDLLDPRSKDAISSAHSNSDLLQEGGMKDKLLLSIAVSFGLVVFCGPLFAHHGNAAFADKPIALKQATVTKFAWANPHSLIEFDAKDDKGKAQHWVAETAAPQALVLIGWSKSSLAPGDKITVYMYQAKTGNPAGRLNKIVLADGSELHDTQVGSDTGSKTRYNNPDGETPGVKPQ